MDEGNRRLARLASHITSTPPSSHGGAVAATAAAAGLAQSLVSSAAGADAATPAATAAAGLVVASVTSATATAVGTPRRTRDIVYGRKFGVALTLDCFEPAQGPAQGVRANGIGIVAIISGGWVSSHDNINPSGTWGLLLDAGYTVFAVVHGSGEYAQRWSLSTASQH